MENKEKIINLTETNIDQILEDYGWTNVKETEDLYVKLKLSTLWDYVNRIRRGKKGYINID